MKEARILKSEIEVFKIYAQGIKTDSINPILSFLKIEIEGDFGSIVKTNLKSFVSRTFSNDSEDCSFLIDEKILFNFLELVDGEYINFTIDGSRISLHDERNKTNSPSERVSMFPNIDYIGSGWLEIPKTALDSIGIAGQIIFDEEITGPKSCVFVGEGAVAGSDATIGFIQKIKEDLPKLVLRKEVALAISKFNSCLCCTNNSYDLFKYNDILLGFSKTETPFFDLQKPFGEIESPSDFFVYKSSFIKWNTYASNSCPSKILAATFKGNNDKLLLKVSDNKYEINTDSYLDILNGQGEFKFSPTIMNNLLKILPCEQVFFHPGKNRYYLTDANKSFLAAIMLIN